MAFNPFLSMGEPAAAPVSTEELNPFMMGDADPTVFTGDNPFAASNPFAEFGGGGFEPVAGDTVPVDIFGAEPDGAKNYEVTTAAVDFFNCEPIDTPRLTKPTELELITTTTDSIYSAHNAAPGPPPRPLPPETQSLILSVTGQMEVTSSHLLDRIPPTRTPSPVSMRDMCLTPEPETLEDPPPPGTQQFSSFDVNRSKPTRPPPARPAAPRPPPPRPAPPPAPPRAVQSGPEEINLFDAPVPVVVKPTNEDILSLYKAPKKEEKQIDFLSDDILETLDNSAHNEVQAPVMTETKNVSPITNEVAFQNAQNDLFSSQMEPTATPIAPMDCSEPQVETIPPNAGSPFAEAINDSFQNFDMNQSEKNPFEMAAEENTPFGNVSTNIFGLQQEEAYTQLAEKGDTVTTETGQIVENVPDNSQTNIFSAEDSFKETQPSNAFTMDQSDAFNNSQQYNDAFNNEADNSAFNDIHTQQNDAFGNAQTPQYSSDAFGSQTAAATESDWGQAPESMTHDAFPESQDAFDAFSAKFDSTAANHLNTNAWGDDGSNDAASSGFEAEAFDTFLSMGPPPPPAATPRLTHEGSQDSADDNFSFNIRPKELDMNVEPAAVPVLAPPPRPQQLPESPRVNPFDNSGFEQQRVDFQHEERGRSGSGGETPPTPLFDEDVSVPLEDFPRVTYTGPGWEMHLRQPNKKKITGQRFWKKIFVRITFQGDNPVVQLFNAAGDKEPFQELPLQACYSVSEVGAQQFDQFGKIFTVKLQYVFYKERPGVRPGQVTKAERITNKLSQFAAYAIQGDYQGVKEFGSDLRKLGLPVEHAPQVSQLFKLGSLNYEDVKQFSCCIEEALFKIPAHRDRALTYKMEEVQITAVDELYVEQDAEGGVLKQIARVRVFFIGFLSGMPDIELGVNDLRRQGKEVVGRHDIIPVVTEEWIRVENQEFHACVQPEEFDNTQIIKFKPPDACYIELMRFRVRPPKNRELPLQLKAVWCVTGNKVELRADILVPGFASRKLGQVPCEDVAIRFPIPECWIYLFRVEKHFRYGSVKSAHRRTGKIKGIERFLGAVDTLQESLIEVTSGQAKYEHQHRAIVWRMPRLPKEGQGAYTTHNLVCRMALTSYDQVPGELARWALVEFTMPATQVSHVTIRSVSLQNHDSDPPEKYVRYLARHEYMVGIERTTGQSAPAYAIATVVEPKAEPRPEPPAPVVPQPPSSDSDSD